MLKGFTVPKSPFGQAALTPPPPWYCRSFPGFGDERSRRHDVLGLEFTAQDDEYLEPARYQYREALVLVDAMHREVPVMWCP
ncbi:hypothetical protein [Bradyrhizobium erythrophlei]|uniref:hypothetical protein n=1 Tax=Bradyrhizobium erythrophlei TaxID=1437360 RepID=UPI000AAB555B|nr:hypothetical protein [Bradyrhizobium erythrophlei]